MKIAILSLVPHVNYGGILQSYALQTVLERMGHEVEVLSKPYVLKEPKWYDLPVLIGKRVLKKIIRKDSTPILSERYYNKRYPIISQNTRLFVEKNIKKRYVEKFSDIKECDYDVFIVGSDQVWRPRYFTRMWNCPIDFAFLSFTRGWNVKRISYAASFGVDFWEYSKKETIEIKKLLKSFNAISVRELDGVRLLKGFGMDVEHVLDPTLLLNKNDYMSFIENEPKSDGNLLVYILDDSRDKKLFVEDMSRKSNLKPFYVRAPKYEIQPKVETWLRGFYDAELVITDSFHACIFSIVFGKPFYVIGNLGRGLSRFNSLLIMLGLADLVVNTEKSIYVPYSNLDVNKLEQIKQHSLMFLRKNLNG